MWSQAVRPLCRGYAVVRRLNTAHTRYVGWRYKTFFGLLGGLALAVYILPERPWWALAFLAVALFEVPSVLAVREMERASPRRSPDLRRPDGQ